MNKCMAYRTLVLSLLISSTAYGQSNTTVGDLGLGLLEKIRQYVSTDLFYTHDYVSNTGGVKSGPRNIGALDLYFESDLSKYSGVEGEMMLHYTHINQNDTRALIGDAQVSSNIDVPIQVDRIADLWYQQNWSEKFKTLVGLHDISMEFNVTESSLSFLNSSFGTAADLSYSGENGPSVYPITSMGVRSLYHFTEELSLRIGFYDSNPGGPETYRSFHSDLGGHDGYLHISEVVHQNDEHKLGLGGWNYTKAQNKINSNGKATLMGLYTMAEQKFTSALHGFMRLSWANPLVNEVQSNIVAGVTYKGIFQRKKIIDEAGVGFTRAHFSRAFIRELAKAEGSAFDSDETAYEAFYNFKPIKELSLRPDVQYITHPSGLKNIKDAWAMGLRTVVEI